MKLLNSIYPHLNINGAILDILVTPGLPKKIASAYPFTPVQALIDTGASESGIALKLAEELKLSPFTERESLLANGQYNAHNVYEMSVLLGGTGGKLFPCRPGGIDMGNFKADGISIEFILGRDILSRCVFTYDGINEAFNIRF